MMAGAERDVQISVHRLERHAAGSAAVIPLPFYRRPVGSCCLKAGMGVQEGAGTMFCPRSAHVQDNTQQMYTDSRNIKVPGKSEEAEEELESTGTFALKKALEDRWKDWGPRQPRSPARQGTGVTGRSGLHLGTDWGQGRGVQSTLASTLRYGCILGLVCL